MANNLKNLDGQQVLRSVFDPDSNRLRVDSGTGPGGQVEIIVTHEEDSIRLGDGTDLVTTTTVGSDVGLDANIINEVNIENLDYTKDNVAIKDSSGDELNINTDGSINIQPIYNSNFVGLNIYDEVSAVTSGSETIVVSHIAAIGKITFLQSVSASGDNIAKYKVKIDGVTIDFKRTNFGNDLNADFIFNGNSNLGLIVDVGDTITVTAEHNRGGVSDFNAKIICLEVS